MCYVLKEHMMLGGLRELSISLLILLPLLQEDASCGAAHRLFECGKVSYG